MMSRKCDPQIVVYHHRQRIKTLLHMAVTWAAQLEHLGSINQVQKWNSLISKFNVSLFQ